MKEPADYMLSVLLTIESTAVTLKAENPKLVDEDAEWVYSKLAAYYKMVGLGKQIAEPTSTIERRQELIDEILNAMDARIEEGEDNVYINNPEYTENAAPIPSLGFLYHKAFKRLAESAAFWRKNRLRGGYFGYISTFTRF